MTWRLIFMIEVNLRQKYINLAIFEALLALIMLFNEASNTFVLLVAFRACHT